MDREEPGREDPVGALSAEVDDRRALDRLVRAFGGWEVLSEGLASDPRSGVEADLALARSVARGRAGPAFRVWRNPRSLVVTARERRLPEFGPAAAALEAEGWPVVVRDSGGTAIPHEPGFVQLSLVLPRPRGSAGLSLEEVYRALLAPARAALRALGLASDFGTVPGSFCDGRFNLVAGGRKIAGTSQRWRARAGDGIEDGFVLAHMTLFAEGDVGGGTLAVNRFQELAGGTDRFDPAASATVHEKLKGRDPGGLGPGAVSEAVERGLVRALARAPGAAAAPR